MKKAAIYIVVLSLVALISIGGTYAFFSATRTKNNAIDVEAHTLEVVYSGDTAIEGDLFLTKNKEEGHRRVVNIGLSEESVGVAANLYIQITNITENLAIDGLKWEVYTLNNGVETHYKSGTFTQCGEINETKAPCVSGDKLYMVTGYELLRKQTNFVVYLWLNGYEVGSEVVGGILKGDISAETEFVTGETSQ